MNRLFGKIYIVDTGGLWLTHDSSATGNFLDFNFQGAVFVSVTSGDLEITAESNTASNTVIRIVNFTGGTQPIDFQLGLFPNERLFVKTCAAGTGFLYLA